MEDCNKRIFVCGHRNPDLDSLAAAAALAELRRRQGAGNITAICPGALPERGRYLFEKFHVPPPVSRNDVYLRIGDIINRGIPAIAAGTPLLEAVKFLNKSGFSRLPVVDRNKKFTGMLSPLNLLSHLLDIGKDGGSSLTGRKIHSTVNLIAKVTDSEMLTGFETETAQEFKVYVAAMSPDSFETHLPAADNRKLAVICGDRPEIHLRALRRSIRVLIVTGEKDVDALILQEAERRQVSILHSRLDSASVIRRLKFSVPVEEFCDTAEEPRFRARDRVTQSARSMLNHPEDVFPVTAEDGTFIGAVEKKTLSEPAPYRMILVDHNETEQSITGIEEIPIIEVVDHHRIGMKPTMSPIRFTGDVVGSTCTLVAAMYRASGESLTPELAGILLGGIVSDTLNLKSPTAAPLDRRMLEWLEKISGTGAEELHWELSGLDSALTSGNAGEVLNADRKSYTGGKYKFSLSQVEESNLELLHQRKAELLETMKRIMEKENLQFFGLLVTDGVRGNSELLLTGAEEIIQAVSYRRIGDNLYALPGVLSRKKQLLPPFLSLTAEFSAK